MLASVCPIEQMPQILPQIQGRSPFLADQHGLEEPGRLDDLPGRFLDLAVLDRDLDVSVAFDPG